MERTPSSAHVEHDVSHALLQQELWVVVGRVEVRLHGGIDVQQPGSQPCWLDTSEGDGAATQLIELMCFSV